MLEHEAHHDRVERAVGKGQRIGVAAGVLHVAPAFVCGRELPDRRVDPDYPGGTVARHQACDLPFAGTDVEHPLRTGEHLPRQRQDLLFVLRVGAVGEALLPPAGVALPEIVVVGGHRAAVSV